MTAFATDLPRAPESVRAARQLVAVHVTGLSETQLADACLMVSELVANALIHGQGAITLRITTGRDRLTIEVADEGDGDVAIAPVPGASGGWGLRVVDELADGWGAREGSTRVWFSVGI
jgi:anti-sigma regulatory factor (Ser/Thr protein kinase)